MVHTAPELAQIERGAPLLWLGTLRGLPETSLWFLDDASTAGGAVGILADARTAKF